MLLTGLKLWKTRFRSQVQKARASHPKRQKRWRRSILSTDVSAAVELLEDRVLLSGLNLNFDAFNIVPTASAPIATVVGDFNEDGIPDLAAGYNVTTPRFAVFLGNGIGGFGSATVFDPGVGARISGDMETADINNDGHLDIVTTHGSSTSGPLGFGNKVVVSLGDGLGGFSTPGIILSTGGSVIHVEIADFNEDGNKDIAVTTGDNMSIMVHLGAGNGTFGSGLVLPFGSGGFGFADILTEDVNGDGHIDIALPRPSLNQIKFYYGSGTGTFASPVTIASGPVTDVNSADFNEDGITDLAATTQAGTVEIFTGLGAGNYSAPVSTSVGSNTGQIHLADFNNDGHIDVVAANPTAGMVSILLGDGSGALSTPVSFTVGSSPGEDMLAADLNGDGLPDVVSTTHTSNSPVGVSILLNSSVQEVEIDVRSTLNLASSGRIAVSLFTTDNFNAATADVSSILFAGASAVQSSLEDVDGDGDLDLVLHFNVADTNLAAIYAQLLADDKDEDGILDSNHQQTEVSLTGQTNGGQNLEGVDNMDLFLSGKNLRNLLDEIF